MLLWRKTSSQEFIGRLEEKRFGAEFIVYWDARLFQIIFTVKRNLHYTNTNKQVARNIKIKKQYTKLQHMP